MGAPELTRSAILTALGKLGGAGEPVTAGELADELGCDSQTASNKLDELAARGDVETKSVGANARVWWTTDHQRQEHELERYEAVFQTVDDGIYVKDEENRFTLVNESYAEMVGYSREELVGMDSSRLVSEEVMEAAEELYRDLRSGDRQSETVEATLETTDGETIETEASFALIPRDGGEYERVGVVRDITERKERERRLERQNKRLESFASMLAHELRNPVTIGQIYSQQLPGDEASGNDNPGGEASDDEDPGGEISDDENLGDEASGDGTPDSVEYVRDAFDRIEDMIDVLLVLARGGDVVGESDPVPIADAAEEAWAEVEASEATLEVTTDRFVRVDRTYLRHLFENLLENSVEHGGSDVTVEVGELPTGFYVADDGAGIPKADRETVFEAGYTTAEAEGGTGVGLTFVQELAEAYEWTCSVTESETGGARFEFSDVTFESEA